MSTSLTRFFSVADSGLFTFNTFIYFLYLFLILIICDSFYMIFFVKSVVCKKNCQLFYNSELNLIKFIYISICQQRVLTRIACFCKHPSIYCKIEFNSLTLFIYLISFFREYNEKKIYLKLNRFNIVIVSVCAFALTSITFYEHEFDQFKCPKKHNKTFRSFCSRFFSRLKRNSINFSFNFD